MNARWVATTMMLAGAALLAIGMPYARAAEDPVTPRRGWAVQFCPAGAACVDVTEPMPGKVGCTIQLAGLRIEASGGRLSCQPRALTMGAPR